MALVYNAYKIFGYTGITNMPRNDVDVSVEAKVDLRRTRPQMGP